MSFPARARRAALLAVLLAGAACRDPRFDANVPPRAEFERLLRRDLAGYFAVRLARPVRVDHQLLLAGPTRVNSAFPAYFAWVRVSSSGDGLLEGVAVLRAMERSRFQVTDFVSAAELRRDPGLAQRLFPRAVAEEIPERLEQAAGSDRQE